jgi:hypothetical protein
VLGFLKLSENDSIKNYFGSIQKMLKRIFLPFLAAQIVIIVPFLITKKFDIKGFISSGGYGPGSYYPWIYVQLWVLMPFVSIFMKKYPVLTGGFMLIVSILCDMVFSLFIQKEWLYRLCISRYLFIFVLSFLLVEEKIPYKYVLFFAVIGAGFLFYHKYLYKNLEPFFYTSWQGERFPSHFYTLLVFIFLYKIVDFIPDCITHILCRIGSFSWEIFLMQMIYFSFNGSLRNSFYINVLLSLFLCIIPIYSYHFMEVPIKINLQGN